MRINNINLFKIQNSVNQNFKAEPSREKLLRMPRKQLLDKRERIAEQIDQKVFLYNKVVSVINERKLTENPYNSMVINFEDDGGAMFP